MFLDRLFGIIATAGFALSVVVHVVLLRRVEPMDLFEPLLLTSLAMGIVALGYATLRAERRHGLIDPADESVAIYAMAYSLPAWTRGVSIILFAYIMILYLGVSEPTILALLPDELSFLQQSLLANGLLAVVVAASALTSFVIAAHFLIREPIKELR